MTIKVKDMTMIAIVATVYCVVTWLISPVAYGPIQFRLSEIMKPLVLKGWVYTLGYLLDCYWRIYFLLSVARGMDMDAGNVFYRRGDCLQVAEMASNINDILFCVISLAVSITLQVVLRMPILFNCFLI